MSRKARVEMIDRGRPKLSISRQCKLVGVSRSSLYYRPVGPDQEDLDIMAKMDRHYLKTPFYGSRRNLVWLRSQGYKVNRKRVRRLMRLMGLETVFRRPNTSLALNTGPTPTCLKGSKSSGSTRYGWPISPTSPWPEAFCI